MIYSYELYKLIGCVIPGAPFNGVAVELQVKELRSEVVDLVAVWSGVCVFLTT